MSLSPETRKPAPNYIQGAIPDSPQLGDTWYDTINESLKIYSEDGVWIRFDLLGASAYPYGYFCGGLNVAGNSSVIDRIEFPFDSGSAVAVGYLAYASDPDGPNAVCNSSIYGYNMGLHSESLKTQAIDRIVFPFDSGTSEYIGNLYESKVNAMGCNSSSFGYFMGGSDNNSGSNISDKIQRFEFSFDSGTASYIASFANTRNKSGSVNSSLYGYVTYGRSGTTSTYLTTISRISFSFIQSPTIVYNTLSDTSDGSSSFNSSKYGYCIVGGSIINRFDFSFDTGGMSNVGSLYYNQTYMGGLNSSNHGFVSTANSTYHDNIERVIFPFDSGTADNVGNLSYSRRYMTENDGTDFVGLFVS